MATGIIASCYNEMTIIVLCNALKGHGYTSLFLKIWSHL